MRTPSLPALLLLLCPVVGLYSAGCSSPSGGGATASGSAAASASVAPSGSVAADPRPWVGIPRSVEEVEKVVNPKGEQPYSGPTGTLKGRVTITGDASPESGISTPAECPGATATYGKVFRKGLEDAAPDVLVTVTGYDGFVPAAKPAVEVKIAGCAYTQRTYAATFGQRFEVSNLDGKASYLPYLDPAPYRAVMIALPHGNPVRVYAYQPAIDYMLRDFQGRTFMTANVFVLKFATHAVTGMDGKYEIPGIPVGKVHVAALLPALGKVVEKDVEITAGDGNAVDLALTFDAKTDKPVPMAPDPWQREVPSGEKPAGFGAAPAKSAVPR